jgi:hypothetical protein
MMKRCAAAVLAFLALGAGSAPAQTDSRTALPPLKAPANSVRPYIDGYDVADCAEPGQVVTVLGRHLAPRGNRRAALGGRELHIDLAAGRWQEHALTVTLPRDRRIEPGARYFIGIEGEQHGRWVSNVDRFLAICSVFGRHATSAAADPGADGRVQDPNDGVPPPEPEVPGPEPSTRPTDPVEPSTPPGGGEDAAEARVSPAPPEDTADTSPSPGENPPGHNPFDTGASPSGELSAPAPLLRTAADDVGDDAADVEPAELLVWHPDLRAAQDFAAQLQALGWSVRRRLVLQGLGVIQTTVGLPPGTGVAAARDRLQTEFPDLLVDANHLYRPLAQSDDQMPLQLVGWSPPADGCAQDKRVGIIDTLVAESHPAFRERDLVGHVVLPAGIELADNRHGTAVAARVAELLPEAAIRVAGVFRRLEGDDADTTAEWLLLALDWLIRERVDVVNMSLGGPRNRLLAAGIERLTARDTGVVAAVGDDGPESPPVYPAALPGVIGVTAVSQDLRVYRRARHGDEVDLAAPGVDLRVLQPDGSAIYLTGTSYATPFVTAAWILAGDSNTLFRSAEDLGAPGRDAVYGAGLVRFDRLCTVSASR